MGAKSSQPKDKKSTHKWSKDVPTVSTFPPEGTFTKPGEEIASIMARKEVSPQGLGSALKMVQFFINRAGVNLSEERRQELEKAKQLLRAMKNREG